MLVHQRVYRFYDPEQVWQSVAERRRAMAKVANLQAMEKPMELHRFMGSWSLALGFDLFFPRCSTEWP